MVDFHRTTMEKFFPQYVEQVTPALRPFGAYGYIDKNNRVLLPPVYTEASDFCNGHALVTWQGKRYLIDTNGKRIKDLGNLDFENFNDGLSIASDGQNKYFMDHNGNKVFGKTLSTPGPLIMALTGGSGSTIADKLKQLNRDKQLTIGFIDTSGKLVTSKEYVGARPFSEGLAAVRIGLNWGFIDRNGKVVIKPQYDQAQSFSDGLAPVRTEQIGVTSIKLASL
ncbi:MAG: WG repeat-containing protein [Candidatus Obscuribacter sp.]|nr:WG repeat-containing protein [Candidatus Obscuribacter sp.]